MSDNKKGNERNNEKVIDGIVGDGLITLNLLKGGYKK